MLCPSCGKVIDVGMTVCRCGGRFVGQPLDVPPLQVKRLGPAMTSLLLLIVMVSASLSFTKWFALASIIVMWSSWRAVRLARRDPSWYGGYRTSVAILSVTLVGSAVLSAYGISRIPIALENRRARQVAATQATMYRVASQLEDYKRVYGSYPKNTLELRRVVGGAIPLDYWEATLKYQSYTEAIAEGANPSSLARTGLPLINFELRSAGADGLLDTDDDVVMRDGIFFSNPEIKKLPAVRIAIDR